MIVATAPGKVMLAGEYAVLWGHPTVVAAVDRRARATIGSRKASASPFLDAVRAALTARYGADAPEVRAAARVLVDTGALARRGRKLGLGSSAATTVSAIGAALGEDAPLELVHAIAHEAHGAAQAPRGSRGSGADVVACVFGGVRRVSITKDVDQGGTPGLPVHAPLAWPPGLPFVLLWTGTPADTPSLVAHVRAFARAAPAAHAERIAALGAVGAALADLLAPARAAAPGAAEVIATIEAGARALAALGEAAGVGLVPPAFGALAALARAHGGAVKPTGAGGGDLILAVLPEPAAVAPFLAAAQPLGMAPISATIDALGLRVAGHAPPD